MKKNASIVKGFTERRREQLETEAQTKTHRAMEEAIGQLPGPSEGESPEGITRELATAYYKETSAWMHRFSDVRSDGDGFFLLHEDNADAWRMQPGDLIQDAALNATPYWQVTENDHFQTKRVSLKPIGPNPFTTGVGAGGAKIYPRDIKVLTGEYEKERIAAIETLIERGEYKSISNVKYMLLGTVATNFGPNGPQGGWYNPGDYSCRGGRRRMTTIDIVKADAQTLRDLGFEISQAAIDGEVPGDEWGRFVDGPVSLFTDWEQTPPFETEIFKKNMILDYEARGLFDDEWRKEQLLKRLDLWDEAIEVWQSRYGLSYQDIDALKDDGTNWQLVDKLKGIWRFLTFATQEEDPSNIQNAILMLNHQQSDIQMRAVARCLMHITSAEDESVDECISALHRFIQSGHGDWLVNEQIINNAKTRQDAEMLIEATHLPDGTNRKYAYRGLIELRNPYVKKAVYTEDHPEALTAIASALYKHLFLPGRAETYYLLEKLVDFMHEDQGTMNRIWARDGVSYMIQLAQKQGLDTDRALEALLDFDKRLSKNPDGELSDQEWVEKTVLRMKQVVGRSETALRVAANPDLRQNKFVLSIDEPTGGDREDSY